MLFQMVSHMTKFNASCRKKLTFKLSKKKKTPCSLKFNNKKTKLENYFLFLSYEYFSEKYPE